MDGTGNLAIDYRPVKALIAQQLPQSRPCSSFVGGYAITQADLDPVEERRLPRGSRAVGMRMLAFCQPRGFKPPVVPDLSFLTGLQGRLDLLSRLSQPASKRPLVMG